MTKDEINQRHEEVQEFNKRAKAANRKRQREMKAKRDAKREAVFSDKAKVNEFDRILRSFFE